MSIYTTPVSKLETSDVQELLQDGGAVENVRLEFKSASPDRDETLKKLSSFANTFGGFMVIGAKANSADGRVVELPGVAPENGYKQKVVQWSFDGASPPFVVEVSDPIPHPTEAGKVFYVVYAPESDLAPHFLNGRKGVWVRTDEFSQRYDPRLATENEIRHLLDRRRLIEERRRDLVRRSEHRFEEFLRHQVPEVVATGRNTPRLEVRAAPRLQISIGPRFPARQICEQAQLVKTLRQCRVDWRQTTFPLTNAALVSQHESALLLQSDGLVEANVWGMLHYCEELEVESDPRPGETSISGVHIYRLVGHLLAIAEHANRMIAAFSLTGALTIQVTLSSILGVPWLYVQQNVPYRGPVSELDDAFSFVLQTTVEAMRENRDALVTDMLQTTLFGMNWADYASNPRVLADLVSTGYKYNYWPTPAP